jgi:sec-independent protein translocase protein TatA
MGLGPMEIVVIIIIGVLLFGKRLPDMGRYLGKSITEFKKGMKGLEDDVDDTAMGSHRPEALPESIRAPQRVPATAPKFEDANITAPPRV